MPKRASHVIRSMPPCWSNSGGLGNQSFVERPSPTGLEIAWRLPFKDQVTAPVVGGDGTVYVGGYDKYLYAISPTGAVVFKDKLIGPVVSDLAIGTSGIVFVAPHHRPPAGLETQLAGIDPTQPKKGRTLWSVSFPGAVPGPLLPDREGGVVAVSSSAVVHAYDASGRERFQAKVGESDPCGATMLADGLLVVIARGPDRDGRDGFSVTGVEPDGAIRFARPIPRAVARPTACTDGGFWVMGTEGALLRFDAAGDELVRLPPLSGVTFQSTSVSALPDGGLRMAIGKRGAGALVALDATGKETGRLQRDDGVASAPLGFVDGGVSFSAFDGTISLVSHTEEVAWSIDVAAPRPEHGIASDIPVVPCPDGLVARVDAANASPNAERQPCELIGLA